MQFSSAVEFIKTLDYSKHVERGRERGERGWGCWCFVVMEALWLSSAVEFIKTMDYSKHHVERGRERERREVLGWR